MSPGESFTMDKLKQSVDLMRSLMAGPPLDIYVNDYLPKETKTEQYEVEVELTRRQRWIEPLINWQTQPFEPWVKTRTEARTREVSVDKAYIVGDRLYVTSAMMAALKGAPGIAAIRTV